MRRSKKYAWMSPLYAAFPLAMSLICGIGNAHADIGSALHPYFQTQPSLISGEDNIISFVMNDLEGPGIAPDDNGEGPSKWGINSNANGLSDEEVYNLTYDQAYTIYANRYWPAVSNLTPDMQLVAFNAEVQFGPSVMQEMIAESGDNPRTLLKEDMNYYRMLAAENPDKFGGSLSIWSRRNAIVAEKALGDEGVNTGGSSDSLIDPLASIQGASSESAYLVSPPPTLESISAAILNPKSGVTLGIETLVLLLPGIPFISLFNVLLKRRRKRAWQEPVPEYVFSSLIPGSINQTCQDTFKSSAAKTRRVALAKEGISRLSSVISSGDFMELSEREGKAFRDIYLPHAPKRDKEYLRYRVDYIDRSHAYIERNKVTLQGDAGIEHSLIYASQAWNNNTCVIKGASQDQMDKIVNLAQRLVDLGTLPSGFAIQGIQPFHPRLIPTAVAVSKYPRAAFSRPESSFWRAPPGGMYLPVPI